MTIAAKIASKVVDDPAQIHRRWSWKISTYGAALGALGAGLQAAPAVGAISHLVPLWVVIAGGALICACVSVSMYIKQTHKNDQ